MVYWQKLIGNFEWAYDAYVSVFQLLYLGFPKKVITLKCLLYIKKRQWENNFELKLSTNTFNSTSAKLDSLRFHLKRKTPVNT